MPVAFSPDPWLVNLRPNPDAVLRLFCIPYAGGGVPVFRSWIQRLPEEIEVWVPQLPGRGVRLREPVYTQLDRLVQDFGLAVKPYLGKPYAIYGHSLGALVGFELVRQFRREDTALPDHLFFSACRAPQTEATELPLHNLSDEALKEELVRLNGTPQEVLEHAELLRMILPMIRGDAEAFETYTYCPEDPLPIPITAFAGRWDRRFQVHQVEAWREQTQSGFSFHTIDGDHFFIHNAEDDFFRIFMKEIAPLARSRQTDEPHPTG